MAEGVAPLSTARDSARQVAWVWAWGISMSCRLRGGSTLPQRIQLALKFQNLRFLTRENHLQILVSRSLLQQLLGHFQIGLRTFETGEKRLHLPLRSSAIRRDQSSGFPAGRGSLQHLDDLLSRAHWRQSLVGDRLQCCCQRLDLWRVRPTDPACRKTQRGHGQSCASMRCFNQGLERPRGLGIKKPLDGRCRALLLGNRPESVYSRAATPRVARRHERERARVRQAGLLSKEAE